VDTVRHTDSTTADHRGRMVLLLIAGIPVTVILAASWLWYFVAQGELDLVGRLGTANSGELLRPPRQALDARWRDASDAPFALGDTPRWTMVVPQRSASCEAACEHQLYELRQIHALLGKNMGRVQRALVSTAAPAALQLNVDALSEERPLPATFAAYIEREQRGLALWQSSENSFDTLFPELLAQPNSWYLMDPAGWIMMRYDSSVSYIDVIGDLKFLLKNSNG
jgi:hypothetical protein